MFYVIRWMVTHELGRNFSSFQNLALGITWSNSLREHWPLGSTCCKNVFISFFSHLQAFYQASRFRLLACKIFLFLLFLFISVLAVFFFLFFQHELPRMSHEFFHMNWPRMSHELFNTNWTCIIFNTNCHEWATNFSTWIGHEFFSTRITANCVLLLFRWFSGGFQ